MKFNLRSISAGPIVHDPSSGERDFLGYALAGFGAIFFSLKAIFVKLAYGAEGLTDPVEPLTMLALRMIFALPFYVAIAIWTFRRWRQTHESSHPPIKQMLIAVALGVLGYYLCALLDFMGLKYITAQLERLLLFTYPAFVLILGALFFGGRVTLSGIISILIAYSGIGLIFSGGAIATGEHMWLGVAFVLAAAFFFAFYQLLAKPQINALGGGMFTCLAMFGAIATTLIHFTLTHAVQGDLAVTLDLPRRVYMLGAMIAIVSTIIPSFMINIALGRIGALPVAVLGMINPIVTVGFAIWLLGEPFSLIDGLGTALTIIGIGLFTWFQKTEPAAVQSQPAARAR